MLSERGLADAVRALALDASLEVAVSTSLPGRPERPVESAVYFAVAELLANAAKHAQATRAAIELRYQAERDRDRRWVGGVRASKGAGLWGIERRMTVFEGRLEIESPAGGPTRVSVTVPCALS